MDAYAERLKAHLEEPGRSQAALADAIGSSQPSIHRYASGDRFPEKDIAEKIEAATEGAVPLILWQRVMAERIGLDLGDAAQSVAA